jgi:WD40 repeat protein
MRPPDDSWAIAVHSSEHGVHPSGSGLAIDRQRILTCAHVARRIQDPGGEIWVAFPKSKNGPVSRLRVTREQVVFADTGAEVQDLAILHLAEPVPPGVDPVPLRDPASASMLAGRWWAFGFPQGDPAGNSARGTIGEVLAGGLLRIDRKSRYGIESGFSGAGVWSPEYRAVVAVITETEDRRGDGRAIPLHHLKACFPDEQIAGLTGRWSAVEAGDVALSAWGWSLTGDPEAEQHWSPRARGVTIGSEHGYRFQGRTAALQVVKDWLDRDRDRAHRRMLVVTGAPGAGKSAVLGRIVTTADADAVKELPASDAAVRANVGSVACAVHAKGKTTLEVATEIARAASAELPKDIDAFPRVLHAALTRQGRRFNVIIDALDEAVSLSEARDIVRKVILPMTETFSDVDARVVAGSRRAGSSGDLLGRYRESSHLVDLDDPEFYAQEDLAAYALATLQLAGDLRSESEQDGEKPNPYADARIAGPVAARIAELSAGNFLVAGLTARTRGIADDIPKSPEQLSFSPRISDVMDDYLKLVPETAGIDGGKLLTALAFAESPGLPVSLWCEAIQVLGYGNVTEVQLVEFTQTRAASFLVESYGQDGNDAVFRLFHQALNDALLGTDDPGLVRKIKERVLTRAFLATGRDARWEHAPAYLLQSLPAHAAHAGMVDELLADNEYLLHADLLRVIWAAGGASSPEGQRRARLLRMTPEAITVSPLERAALFSVTEVLENLGNAYRVGSWLTPYRALCAATTPRQEHITCTGHQAAVHAVCAVTVDGETLLASGDGDTFSFSGMVRIWDPSTGQQRAVLEGHQNAVKAVCGVTVDGETLLASGDEHGTVRIWDPSTGQQRAVLDTHQVNQPDTFHTMCAVIVDGKTLLAVGDGYVSSRTNARGTVRVWDLSTGQQRAVMKSHHGPVLAMCPVTVDGETLLAAGGWTVQVWDPSTGQQRAILETGGSLAVKAVCGVTVDGETLLAVGNIDGTVRIWDPSTGQQRTVMEAQQYPLWSVCPVTLDGETLLAAGSGDGTVRVWDPSTGQQRALMKSREGQVLAMCAVTVDGRTLLAFNGHRTVQIWELSDKRVGMPQAHQAEVHAVCGVTVDGETLLASGGAARTVPTFDLFDSGGGAVRLWDPATGQQRALLEGHQDTVRAVCAVTVDGETLLASGDDDGMVRVWDPSTGQQRTRLENHENRVFALCAVMVGGETLLASGCGGKVLVWDLSTGQQHAVLSYPGPVQALCAVTVGGETLLAYGGGYTGHGGMVRVWDPTTGQQRAVLEGHQDEIWAVCAVTVEGETLLASGGDRTVRVWDPTTGQQRAVLEGHQDTVRAVCAVTVEGETLLASGGDRTVRVWDPRTGTCVATVPTRHAPRALTGVADSLAIGMDAGILVIRPGVTG